MHMHVDTRIIPHIHYGPGGVGGNSSKACLKSEYLTKLNT